MLDTVILKIPLENCAFVDYGKFGTTKEKMRNCNAQFFKWINNPTAEDKAKGIYKPRLTITKRGRIFDLKIEFSAPKLLFDNNLEELEEADFDKVVMRLKQRLEEMGIRIFTHLIIKATISCFHPSKNITLNQGYTATLAIKELAKTNVNKKFDLTEKTFMNGGQSLQLYTNSNSFVIYDKITDLGKPEKRALDKEQTKQQLTLFDFIKKEHKPIEILRFEIRLSNKIRMKSILKEIGYPTNPLFKDIFKKDLCQKIIKLYWNKFFESNLFLFDINNNPQKILQKVFMAYPKIKPKQAIYLVGLNVLCKDEEGVRGLKTVIDSYRPKTKWIRVNSDLKKFQKPVFNQNLHGFIADIQKELKEFTAFRYNKST